MGGNKPIHGNSNGLGGETEFRSTGERCVIPADRIPHSKLLRDLQLSEEITNTLVDLYRQHVLAGRTRTIHLLGRKHTATILHTLLGYEVQASYKRIQCPDMVTARYLKLFTELGCRSIRLPYDPTVTAGLLTDMEGCIANISNGLCTLFPNDRALRNYALRKVYEIIREQLKKSG